jgi:hypothetical protein
MSAMIIVVSLQMWRLSVFGQQPSSPVLEEFRSGGNEKYYHGRRLCCIQDTDSETDSLDGDRIEVQFDDIAHNDLVRCS